MTTYRVLLRCVLLAVAATYAPAQTRVDLRTQGKSVDFSSATSTRPSKTGTALPAACAPGQTFFKTDAPVGANLYGCTAPDVWTPLNSGTGAVSSVFGRTGAVVAQSEDYAAMEVTNTPAGGIAATTVQGAIYELDADKAALAGVNNFTRGQKVAGSADEIQLELIGFSGQTQPLMRVRKSDGTVLFEVGPDTGPLALGNQAEPGTPAAGTTHLWADSSDKKLKAKDDAGNVSSTVGPASASLAAALNDETGTGVAVFGTTPTLTTPIVAGYTVAGLPAAGSAGRLAVVTDASTAGSCTSGGGSALALCRDSGSAWQPVGDGGSGGGGVSSFEGRTGAVVSAAGDYTASEVTNTPSGAIAATTVQGAVNELDNEKAALAAANNFTRGQRVAGSADEIQLELTASSGQTQPMMRVRKSDGTVLFEVGPDTGPLTLANQAAPGTPASGKTYLWVDSTDRKLKTKDDAGKVLSIGGSYVLNVQANLTPVTPQNAVEQTLFTYTLPANVASTAKMIHVRAWTIASGLVYYPTYKLYFGSINSSDTFGGNQPLIFQGDAMFRLTSATNATGWYTRRMDGTRALDTYAFQMGNVDIGADVVIKLTITGDNSAETGTITPAQWFVELLQ